MGRDGRAPAACSARALAECCCAGSGARISGREQEVSGELGPGEQCGLRDKARAALGSSPLRVEGRGSMWGRVGQHPGLGSCGHPPSPSVLRAEQGEGPCPEGWSLLVGCVYVRVCVIKLNVFILLILT